LAFIDKVRFTPANGKEANFSILEVVENHTGTHPELAKSPLDHATRLLHPETDASHRLPHPSRIMAPQETATAAVGAPRADFDIISFHGWGPYRGSIAQPAHFLAEVDARRLAGQWSGQTTLDFIKACCRDEAYQWLNYSLKMEHANLTLYVAHFRIWENFRVVFRRHYLLDEPAHQFDNHFFTALPFRGVPEEHVVSPAAALPVRPPRKITKKLPKQPQHAAKTIQRRASRALVAGLICTFCGGGGHSTPDCRTRRRMMLMLCAGCGEKGHLSDNCPRPTAGEQAQAMESTISALTAAQLCRFCGGRGHARPACRIRQRMALMADSGSSGSLTDGLGSLHLDALELDATPAAGNCRPW
jgi:hypothetical protein